MREIAESKKELSQGNTGLTRSERNPGSAARVVAELNSGEIKRMPKVNIALTAVALCGIFAQFNFAQSTISGSLTDNSAGSCIDRAIKSSISGNGGVSMEPVTGKAKTEAINSIVLTIGAIGNFAPASIGGVTIKSSAVGDAKLRNTTATGSISSNTVRSQTVILAIGDHAEAYVGGVHSK